MTAITSVGTETTLSVAKLFVSMPCYEDADVIASCHSLITNACSPDDVRICVVLQTDAPERFERLSAYPQVEIHVHPRAWATGVARARSLAASLIDDEELYLQTDCHVRFQQDWDELLCRELLTHPESSVLSALPPGFSIATGELLSMEPLFPRLTRFSEGMPFSDFLPDHGNQQLLIPHVAGGLVFCKAEAVRDVAPDPFYHYCGEELSQSLRWWTSGYSIYGLRPLILHHAYRDVNAKAVDNISDTMLHWRSMQRINVLLGAPREGASSKALIDIDKYWLGSQRSLASWEEAFHVDLKQRSLERHYSQP